MSDNTNDTTPSTFHPDPIRPFKPSPKLECFREYEPVAVDPYDVHDMDVVEAAEDHMWHAARTTGRASGELAPNTPKEQIAELTTRLDITFNAYEQHRAANTRLAEVLRTVWLAAVHGEQGIDTYPDELTARNDILTALAHVPKDDDPFGDDIDDTKTEA